MVLTRSELVTLGLAGDAPRLLGRIGEVVALATSQRFPISDPDLRYEHGGLQPDELLVPLATWHST